ncbi:uncharacterized protein isoform X2 [Rhodnius prolixus]|uniref:uncharacterized protein isoform X2 n=1 Tax=Rhodnius prolixus TaxID=13249 RepID=UPI003D18EDDE
MSIHVTVNSNPLCINRSKVLLSDLELAKKNEWNRRRKLRLQQVRQQARDLASNLRKKCDAEKELNHKQECEENEQELKEWQAKRLQKLQKEYDNCIAAIGTGHRTAICQVEDEKIAKEKAELREALAKARGDLARERAKLSAVQAKPTSVANKRSPAKRIEMCQQNERNKSRKCFQKNKIKEKTPVKSSESNPFSSKENRNQVTIDLKTNYPTECIVTGPGIPVLQQKQATNMRQQNFSSPSKSGNLKQVTICGSDGTDYSNATWPPRSARVRKTNISPQKVRFYNHDERISKEYVKPAKSVTHLETKFSDAMEKYVEKEEEEVIKRAEFDAAVKKRSASRGQKALSKERLEREFKSMASQLSEIDKQQRIARIFEFPYPITAPKSSKGKEPEKSPLLKRPSTSKEPEVDVYKDMKKCFEIGSLSGPKKIQKEQKHTKKNVMSEKPFTLKNLIENLEKERDLLLNSTLENSPSKNFDESCERGQSLHDSNAQEFSQKAKHKSLNKASTSEKNIAAVKVKKQIELSSHKTSFLQRENEENIDSLETSKNASRKEKAPHPIEVNVITKPLCDCCEACNCTQQQQKNLISSENVEKPQKKDSLSSVLKVSVLNDDVKCQQPSITDDTIEDPRDQSKTDKQEVIVTQKNRCSLDKISSIRVKAKQNSCFKPVTGSGNSENGIKVTVTVRERNSSPNKVDDQESINPKRVSEIGGNDIPWYGRLKNDNDLTNSSSSFYSPPSKLTSAQEAVLNSILLKMCLKNNNPELHKYIKRLLLMNKANIDNLPVSSSSEISIHSDIFSEIRLDQITGTYYLEDNRAKSKKKIVFTESKSRTGITSAEMKPLKKVVHLNTSSEESTNGERTPNLKASVKSNDSLQSNLADEYSIRLQQLIEMLNQASPRYGEELRCNESTSSYAYPTLSERLETNSDIADFECYNASVTASDGWTVTDSLNKKRVTISNFEDVGNSSFVRNNITSLGLPFELLPKPFSLAEAATEREPPPKHKPPVSSNKYRMQDLLPHELSAIPEVSSHICHTEPEILQSRNLKQENNKLHFREDQDSEMSDISSIYPGTPKTIVQKKGKKKTQLEEPVAGTKKLASSRFDKSVYIFK